MDVEERANYCEDCRRSIWGDSSCDENVENNGKYVGSSDICYNKCNEAGMTEKYPWEDRNPCAHCRESFHEVQSMWDRLVAAYSKVCKERDELKQQLSMMSTSRKAMADLEDPVMLVVEVPKDYYEIIQLEVSGNKTDYFPFVVIGNGVPLADVQAEMIGKLKADLMRGHVPSDLVHVGRVLEILDQGSV